MSKPITIITGSSLGNAEYVAESIEPILAGAGFNPDVKHGPVVGDLPHSGVWLVICSTHGAGELPDNLQPWLDEIIETECDLTEIHFGAIGLGSSDYDLFCGAIKTINQTLIAHGAKPIGETLFIDSVDDRLPEELAEEWVLEWISLIRSQ